MTHKKTIYISSILAMTTVSLACLFSIYCLYKSLSGAAIRSRQSTEAVASLSVLKDKIKAYKSGRDLQFLIKSTDSIPSSIMPKEMLEQLRNTISKASSNHSVDSDEMEIAKQNLISNLFNFYRQQVVKRNMAVASSLSGLIAEAHGAFFKQPDLDAYLIFAKHTKDQMEYIKNFSKGFTDSDQINARCRQIESQLVIFTNVIKQQLNHQANRDNFIRDTDLLLNSSINEITGKLDKNISILQRNFIISIFLFIVSILISLTLIKLVESKFEKIFNKKITVFSKILNNFGRNEEVQHLDPDMHVILSDKSWARLLDDLLKSEATFKNKNAAEVILSKSITNAFIVFSQNKRAIYWNSFASRALDISGKDEVDELSIEALFTKCGLLKRKEYFNDLINKIDSGKEASAFVYLKQGNDITPYEIVIYPIQTSSLKGGFVVVLRDMRGEEQRVAKRVSDSFSVIEKLITNTLERDGTDQTESIDFSSLPNNILPLVEKLKLLNLRNRERDSLWNSEIEALKEKAEKEREILDKFAQQIKDLQSKDNLIQDLTETAADAEEELFKLSNTFESLLSQANFLMQQAAEGIESYSLLSHKSMEYEKLARSICKAIEDSRQSYKDELETIRGYRDWVKMHAINLNLGKMEGNTEEFKDRARKFSVAINKFYEKVQEEDEKISKFIEQHPGAMPVEIFNKNENLEASILQLKEIYQSLQTDISVWKKVYQELKNISEDSKKLSQNMLDHRKEMDILTQACIQVNDSSLEGMKRWV